MRILRQFVNSWFICANLMFSLISNGSCCSNVNSSLDTAWNQFKLTYKKNYNKNEECLRRSVWQSNLLVIDEHNKEAGKGKYTYWMGMNSHGDRTDKEITKMYLGGHAPTLSSFKRKSKEPHRNRQPFQSSQVDWRDRGCNISANDQQPCGACYIFAALASLECHHSIKSTSRISERLKKSRRLSVQQIVDCAERNEQSIGGCGGGLPEEVYLWDIRLQENGFSDGFVADSCYPFTGIDRGQNCSQKLVKKCNYRVHVGGFQLYSLNIAESDLQNVIDKKGPVVSGMSVLPSKFRWYKNGVYSDPTCSMYYINHAVALWGFGGGSMFSKEPRYWVIKNSFGSSWGDNGFAKVSRNNSVNCNLEVSFLLPDALDRKKN